MGAVYIEQVTTRWPLPLCTRRAERFLVALPTAGDLLICAKYLLVEAMAPMRAMRAQKGQRLSEPFPVAFL
jgi:hypothetical protein